MIPRSPIAELINNAFQPWLDYRPQHILDLCTGSGAIAVACANTFPTAKVDAVDISSDALAVAEENRAAYQLQDRIELIQSNLFEKVAAHQQYDLIVSNPPYVGFAEMQTLPREYAYEPTIAFSGGDKDGLGLVAKMLTEAKQYLTERGALIVEVGNSDEALAARYTALPFTWLEFEKGGHGVFLLYAQDLPS